MTSGSASRSLASVFESLRTLLTIGRDLRRLAQALGLDRLGGLGRRTATTDDADTAALLARADAAAREAHRRDEAIALYRQVLERHRTHAAALRGVRDLSIQARRWSDALSAEERLLSVAAPGDRPAESEWLAAILYELGREDLAGGRADAAIAHFRQAVRADRHFVPAPIALGDAHEAAGDLREAVRAWERAAEVVPSLPVLARLERAYRVQGRPSRMIALYREAAERAPHDLAVAAALGRVYFELEMLDEAADQFEKMEVRAPDLPVIHAYLGAVFERRGDTREAFDEYRRALRLGHAFSWPHRCDQCGTTVPTWDDRCAQCGRWNTLRPVDR